jgi:hypothetical protein
VGKISYPLYESHRVVIILADKFPAIRCESSGEGFDPAGVDDNRGSRRDLSVWPACHELATGEAAGGNRLARVDCGIAKVKRT